MPSIELERVRSARGETEREVIPSGWGGGEWSREPSESLGGARSDREEERREGVVSSRLSEEMDGSDR